MGSKIAIRDEDGITVHAAVTLHNYDTLCGMDGDDPGVGTKSIGATTKKIDCKMCTEIWKEAKKYKNTDFK